MPYGTIALLAAVLLSAWFVVASDASRRSKLVVLALCLGSLAIGYLLPQWALVGLLIQTALAIGLVLYARLQQ